jgi:integrase
VTPSGGERRRITKGGFRTKTDAERALGQLEQQRREGSYVEKSKVLTGAYLGQWVETVGRVRESTRASYRGHIKNHLIPALGDIPLQALTRQHVKTAYAGLRKTKDRGGGSLAAHTRWHIHLTLHNALADAVEDNLISSNPADRAMDAPAASAKPEMECWNETQLRDFLTHVKGDKLYALWRLFLTTGARRGELLGLRWDDVDLLTGRISFKVQWSKQDGVVAEGPIKTKRGRRTIDISPADVDALIAHMANQAEAQDKAGAAWHNLGLVFCRDDGRHFDPDGISSRWRRHVKASGVKKIKLHEARHTHATLMLAIEPVHVVSRRLGHASEAFTLEQYSHVLPQQQERAAARFAALVDAGSPRGGVNTASESLVRAARN